MFASSMLSRCIGTAARTACMGSATELSMHAGRRQLTVLAQAAAAAGTPKRKVVCVLYSAGAVAAREPRLLGCVENALGLRKYFEARGDIEFIVTSDKEGENSVFDQHLKDAEIIISTPFHPAYITAARIAKAPKLKLALTAGVGSDHVDLAAAAKAGITVAEVTGSNVVSVAEHVVMLILNLVRNFVAGHEQAASGKWDVSLIAEHAFDLEGKVVGTVGAGRIGQRVLQRLLGFGCAELLYSDYARLPLDVEKALNCRYVELEELVRVCDVVTINCPLHPSTVNLFDAKMIAKMKKGAFLVNTARGAICDPEAVAAASRSGQLGGYAGDVWNPQPAPADHCWRTMPNNAMTPHYSGTTLDAQGRYAAGTKDILERYFSGATQKASDIILQGGKLAAQYDKSGKANLVHEKGWELDATKK